MNEEVVVRALSLPIRSSPKACERQYQCQRVITCAVWPDYKQSRGERRKEAKGGSDVCVCVCVCICVVSCTPAFGHAVHALVPEPCLGVVIDVRSLSGFSNIIFHADCLLPMSQTSMRWRTGGMRAHRDTSARHRIGKRRRCIN